MTYKEKLQTEHPKAVDAHHLGGCQGCPGDYFPGAPCLDDHCVIRCFKGTGVRKTCTDCWSTEVPAEDSIKRRVVYIAGPITGVSHYWEPFEEAEEHLIALGVIPLSPAHHPQGLTNAMYTRINNAMIDCADAVLFLPESHKSRGALAEYAHCGYIGKPIAHSIEELKEVLKKCKS